VLLVNNALANGGAGGDTLVGGAEGADSVSGTGGAGAAGFTAYVIEDACRAIDLNGSLQSAWQKMAAAGVMRIQSTDLIVK